jgi:hypothetical protein
MNIDIADIGIFLSTRGQAVAVRPDGVCIGVALLPLFGAWRCCAGLELVPRFAAAHYHQPFSNLAA